MCFDQVSFRTPCRSNKSAKPKNLFGLFLPFSKNDFFDLPFAIVFLPLPLSSQHCRALYRFGPVSNDPEVETFQVLRILLLGKQEGLNLKDQ